METLDYTINEEAIGALSLTDAYTLANTVQEEANMAHSMFKQTRNLYFKERSDAFDIIYGFIESRIGELESACYTITPKDDVSVDWGEFPFA